MQEKFEIGEVAIIHYPQHPDGHLKEVTIIGPMTTSVSGEPEYPVQDDPWIRPYWEKYAPPSKPYMGNPHVIARFLRKRRPPKEDTGSWEAIETMTRWRPGIFHDPDKTTHTPSPKETQVAQAQTEGGSISGKICAFCRGLLSP